MPDTIEIEGVRITHPDRAVYPDQGITKRQVAEYYRSIAHWILPAVKDRPLTLVRCPGGLEKECFVQRHAGDSIPTQVRRVEIPEDDGETATYLSVDTLPGLVGLVQVDVLEFHTWGARRDRLDRPDRMVIDLDPDPQLSFSTVAEAALRVRSMLVEAGLASFVMTTGGKGLHVVAPLRRTVGWDAVREAARAVAERLSAEDPHRFVSRAAKAERTNRIYVDYLRNGRSATSIAAYSTRARAGAPVATPLTWNELESGATPGGFSIATVPDRMRALKAEPWADFRSSSRALTGAVRARIERR